MARYHAHHNFLQIQPMNVLTIFVRIRGNAAQETYDCDGGLTDITGALEKPTTATEMYRLNCNQQHRH